jgi:hypothetical protein
MRNRWSMLGMALALIACAGTRPAHANSDGLSFRAVGFFDSEAASGGGTCQIPGIDSGIPVSSDTIGLWNTFGIPTIQWPGSSCDGWMELQNVMTAQGVSVNYVDIRLRIAGAGRFRSFVPTRNGFPTACRSLRKAKVFSGAHLFPVGTDPAFGNTGSGAAQVAFVNLFPMVSSQVIHCLREQYASLPSSTYVSLPLVIRATAVGRTDSGGTVKSNPIEFTLTLLHLCGNGRVDFGEVCDPNAPSTCGIGPCDTTAGTCRRDNQVVCATDADCGGTCLPQGDVNECTCGY